MGVVNLTPGNISNATSGTLTIAIPTAGNSLIALIGTYSSATVSSVTSTNATWSRVSGGQSTAPGGWNHTVEVWLAENIGSSPGASVTVTISARGYAAFGIYELAGDMLLDGSPTYSGGSGTTGSTSTSTSSGVFLAGLFIDILTNSAVSVNSPFTKDGQSGSNQMLGAYASYAPGAATGSQTATFTWSSSHNDDNVLVSFRSNIKLSAPPVGAAVW